VFAKKYIAAFFNPMYRIPVASSALSYYLVMTFFPLLIILYSLLGNSYELASRGLEYFSSVIPAEPLEYIRTFLKYIAENQSNKLLFFACSVIVATCSAAIRSVQTTIGLMQGGSRYEGIPFFIISVALSFAFVLLFYAAILTLFITEDLINFINQEIMSIQLHGIDLGSLQLEHSWVYFRFVLLFVIAFVTFFFLFLISRRRNAPYSIFWGALVSTVVMVGTCFVFSFFITRSVKYPLVYSSLSSLVLLLLWLYFCSYSVYAGALFNIILHETRRSGKNTHRKKLFRKRR